MLRVLGPLAQCDILSALNIFNARRYALTNGIYYGPVSVRLVVTSRCRPITVVCKATRVYMPILSGVV